MSAGPGLPSGMPDLEYIYLHTPRIRLGAAVALCAALLLGNAAAAQATGLTPTPLHPATTKQAPTGKTTPTPRPATPADGGDQDGSWTVQDAIRFWTPERIASATDPLGSRRAAAGLDGTAQEAVPDRDRR